MESSSGLRIWVICLTVAIIAATIGALVGFAVGQRQGMAWGENLVGSEAGVNTVSAIEAATLLREDQSQEALKTLDWRIQTALRNFEHGELGSRPHAIAQALQFGALYRSRYGTGVTEGSQAAGAQALRILKDGAADAGGRGD